jgi:hypothetical protein
MCPTDLVLLPLHLHATCHKEFVVHTGIDGLRATRLPSEHAKRLIKRVKKLC